MQKHQPFHLGHPRVTVGSTESHSVNTFPEKDERYGPETSVTEPPDILGLKYTWWMRKGSTFPTWKFYLMQHFQPLFGTFWSIFETLKIGWRVARTCGQFSGRTSNTKRFCRRCCVVGKETNLQKYVAFTYLNFIDKTASWSASGKLLQHRIY